MTVPEKIAELRDLIRQRLTPLLSGDCVLLDCPYYANVGDTLIWEGELAFLREAGQRVRGYGSISTWLFPKLDPRTVILLSGGGSFGDLWRPLQEFRLRVIAAYPDNPIVILPQTVHYEDATLMVHDAEAMACHPRLTICARDERSETIVREHFRNDTLLLPDMAFCIPPESLTRDVVPKQARALLLRRDDKERAAGPLPEEVPAGAAVRDWPTMERTGCATWRLYKLCGACDRLARAGHDGALRHTLARRADRLAFNTVRPRNIRAGVGLLSAYGAVYSTRLHGAILSMLTGKPETYMIDNHYGKNSAFYRTWLRDAEGVHLLK